MTWAGRRVSARRFATILAGITTISIRVALSPAFQPCEQFDLDVDVDIHVHVAVTRLAEFVIDNFTGRRKADSGKFHLIQQCRIDRERRVHHRAQAITSGVFDLRRSPTMFHTYGTAWNRPTFTPLPGTFRPSCAAWSVPVVRAIHVVVLFEWTFRCVASPTEGGVTGGHCGKYRPDAPAVSCATIRACHPIWRLFSMASVNSSNHGSA